MQNIEMKTLASVSIANKKRECDYKNEKKPSEFIRIGNTHNWDNHIKLLEEGQIFHFDDTLKNEKRNKLTLLQYAIVNNKKKSSKILFNELSFPVEDINCDNSKDIWEYCIKKSGIEALKLLKELIPEHKIELEKYPNIENYIISHIRDGNFEIIEYFNKNGINFKNVINYKIGFTRESNYGCQKFKENNEIYNNKKFWNHLLSKNNHQNLNEDIIVGQIWCDSVIPFNNNIIRIPGTDAKKVWKTIQEHIAKNPSTKPDSYIYWASPGHHFISISCDSCNKDGKPYDKTIGFAAKEEFPLVNSNLQNIFDYLSTPHNNKYFDFYKKIFAKVKSNVYEEEYWVEQSDINKNIKIKFFINKKQANNLVNHIYKTIKDSELGKEYYRAFIDDKNCVGFCNSNFKSLDTNIDPLNLLYNDELLNNQQIEASDNFKQLYNNKANIYGFIRSRGFFRIIDNFLLKKCKQTEQNIYSLAKQANIDLYEFKHWLYNFRKNFSTSNNTEEFEEITTFTNEQPCFYKKGKTNILNIKGSIQNHKAILPECLPECENEAYIINSNKHTPVSEQILFPFFHSFKLSLTKGAIDKYLIKKGVSQNDRNFINIIINLYSMLFSYNNILIASSAFAIKKLAKSLGMSNKKASSIENFSILTGYLLSNYLEAYLIPFFIISSYLGSKTGSKISNLVNYFNVRTIEVLAICFALILICFNFLN